MLVGDDLKLDVVGIDDELLDVKRAVAECFLRFVPRRVKSRAEARFIVAICLRGRRRPPRP
jgi:hypothetical protein